MIEVVDTDLDAAGPEWESPAATTYVHVAAFPRFGMSALTSLAEFDDHALVSFVTDAATGLRGVIAIHRVNPAAPSFGGTRLWHYASDLDGVRDALRLSRQMSYKAALAGLDCGGAKGVVLGMRKSLGSSVAVEQTRAALISAYTERVNAFGGQFVTGPDLGIQQVDLDAMRRRSSHIVGFNGNATEFTALGVLTALKTALHERFGSPEVAGRRIAIQGLGKVGGALLALLHGEVGARGTLYVADIDAGKVADAVRRFAHVTPVPPAEIAFQPADVFCPCALSGAIDPAGAERIGAGIVVGCANNQLADDRCGDLLHARGVLYVPDYVANAGGLIAVYDEHRHATYDRARVQRAVLGIADTVRRLFTESRETGMPPYRIANLWAERKFNPAKGDL